jgi:hypothetical protein
MAGKRAQGLLEMMFFIEMSTLNPAWNGLSDEVGADARFLHCRAGRAVPDADAILGRGMGGH